MKDRPKDDERAYVLGTGDDELTRLGLQHEVWVGHARALWERAGVGEGSRVVDLGCGPGFTSLALARVVGPGGSVVARDLSPRFVAHLAAERERLGLGWVEPSLGPAEELEVAPGSFDAAYARWLLCWLPEATLRATLARVAAALRPGGALLVQDYVAWGAMRLLPQSDAFDRAVAACLASYAAAGPPIDAAVASLPALAPEAGLRLEELRPIARAGPVGSPEWRWLASFHRTYLPKLVPRGLLSAAERDAALGELERRERDGVGLVLAPVAADVVLRRP